MIQEIKKFRLICDDCGKTRIVETNEYFDNSKNNLQLDKDFVEKLGWSQKESVKTLIYNYTEVLEFCRNCTEKKKKNT